MLEDLSDAELLTRSARDAQAFACFYRRYVDAVIAYFSVRTPQPEIAADLTSETFAAALLAAKRFSAERGTAVAWLFGIAHHKLTDSQRRSFVEKAARDRLGMEPVLIEDADLARIAELGSPIGAVAALAHLPHEQRDAVVARILNEDSYDAIAGKLRVSEAVVRQRVSRGLRTLRQRLEDAT
jgi:RNA polymerase sigma-70 factor (ECF subfamily)